MSLVSNDSCDDSGLAFSRRDGEKDSLLFPLITNSSYGTGNLVVIKVIAVVFVKTLIDLCESLLEGFELVRLEIDSHFSKPKFDVIVVI